VSLNATTAIGDTSGPGPDRLIATSRYRLLDEIARGGMGVVYRAMDTILNREVAVKVLQDKFAPDSGTARRFFDEARIAGQLQHPGIPPVHDLGHLDDGRPYLAMKLIKGRTLDELLRDRTDITGERARFVAAFEQICHALAYAHAHQVIHRDLKPANVMVGSFGEVQVMDWGLAKVLSPRENPPESELADQTTPATEVRSLRESDGSFTQAGSVLGTPAFMPPEQAVGAIGKIDARSDVFGLGAILAVILTGRPPFVGDSAETTRVKAAQGDLTECFARLESCGAEPELIALCRRCLSPRPADRPAAAGDVAKTVAALRVAADERARLAEVERERVTFREVETRKRRRVWLGLAGVLALGLVAAVVLAIMADTSRRKALAAEKNAVDRRIEAESAKKNAEDRRIEAESAKKNAEDRRIEAETARRKAEDETQLANAVKLFLQQDVLQLADPKMQQQDGRIQYDANVRLRDVVLRASQTIEGKFTDRPQIEAELRVTLANALQGMGRPDLAVSHWERVLEITKQIGGPDHPFTLKSMNSLAGSYSALGRNSDALKLDEETLALSRQKFGPDHTDTLSNMNNLANSYSKLGRYEDALKLLEQVLPLRREKLGPDHPATLNSMNNLANIYSQLGRQAEALKLREETLSLRKQKLGPDHPDTLKSMSSVAISYSDLGRRAEALKLFDETLAISRQKLGPDHPDTLLYMNNLSVSYSDLGRHEDALKLREETLSIRRQKLGTGHPQTHSSMSNLANTYATLGRHADAFKLREELLTLLRQKLGPDHPETLDSASRVIQSRLALKEFDRALPEIDSQLKLVDQAAAAGKRPYSRLKPDLIEYRSRIFLERKDAVGYRETIEMDEKLGRNNANDANAFHRAARYRAVLSGLLVTDKPDEAKREADKAMDWLRKAVAAGWQDHAQMLKDSDLDSLRNRDDFKKLMGELEAKVKEKSPTPPQDK
jgi:serine/threonine protein kinase